MNETSDTPVTLDPTDSAAAAAGDPWAAAGASAPGTDPADAPPIDAGPADAPAADASAADAASPWNTDAQQPASTNWLDAPAAHAASGPDAAAGADASTGGFHLHNLWDGSLPVTTWINDGLNWVVQHFRPAFQSVRTPIDATLASVTGVLQSAPPLALTVLVGLLAWQFAGRKVAIGAVLSLLVVRLLGIWPDAMVTLSLVLTSLVFCVVIGLPLGILLAASDRTQRWVRPVLDAMQTTPAFVYLVPVVMLFGIGNVPGVIVTIIFALPPLVRLTALGIRQVRPDLVEAARAYGASPWQLLVKVQLPLAMPSIMAGINQALMLSLSMVVVASMIAVGGLGQMVLRGIGRLDMGLASIGGLGIVLLAVTLDRITQAMGQARRGAGRWWQSGPAGVLARLVAGASADRGRMQSPISQPRKEIER